MPKGHQKSAKGQTKYISKLGPKKVSVTRSNRGEGGALEFVEHLWCQLVDLGSQFGRPLDLGGSIRWAFLDVFGANKINK